MSFSDDIKLLSQKALYLQSHSMTLETLKTSIILPYFQYLGYDVFDPDEFIPSYGTAGQKVDFATIRSRIAHTLVKAEPFGTPLKTDCLASCFAAYKPKMALLTNGIEYRYYTDSNTPGIMDDEPFFAFDFSNLTESDITTLSKFQKSEAIAAESPSFIQTTKYCLLIKKYLQQQFSFASDDFIRHLLESVEPNREFDASFVDTIRPTIDQALKYTINDIITAKITDCLNEQPPAPQLPPCTFQRHTGYQRQKKSTCAGNSKRNTC